MLAGVWTRGAGRQLRLAGALQSGQVFVNNYGAGGGAGLPCGGMKGLGLGREKGFEALYGSRRSRPWRSATASWRIERPLLLSWISAAIASIRLDGSASADPLRRPCGWNRNDPLDSIDGTTILRYSAGYLDWQLMTARFLDSDPSGPRRREREAWSHLCWTPR
jgi:hypothetical protein